MILPLQMNWARPSSRQRKSWRWKSEWPLTASLNRSWLKRSKTSSRARRVSRTSVEPSKFDFSFVFFVSFRKQSRRAHLGVRDEANQQVHVVRGLRAIGISLISDIKMKKKREFEHIPARIIAKKSNRVRELLSAVNEYNDKEMVQIRGAHFCLLPSLSRWLYYNCNSLQVRSKHDSSV